ncbi:hypothetical protein G6F22_018822 [Rhizopus arrhizus]|nr:hypothetical protein G6F22_018822 [Rhizopus arrhizus]
MDAAAIEVAYETMRARCMAAAAEAEGRPKLQSLQDVMAPLAPYTPAAVLAEARREVADEAREALYGGAEALPERQAPRHLAIQINHGLQELLAKTCCAGSARAGCSTPCWTKP